MTADLTREKLAARGAPISYALAQLAAGGPHPLRDAYLESALRKAYYQGQLITTEPAALAASPEVQALIREAEARVWDAALAALKLDPPYGKANGALMRGREIGYRDAIYDTQQAIRAEAAAIRGETP